MRMVIIAFVLFTGCKKGSNEQPEKKEASMACDAAVAAGVEKTIAKRRGANSAPMTPQEEEVPKKLKAALGKSCVVDKWSAEVIDCFKTADDIAQCKDKLTPEQRAAYTKAAMSAMAGQMPGGGMGSMHGAGAGGMGSAPAGSAAPGSADTGSAGSAPGSADTGSAK